MGGVTRREWIVRYLTAEKADRFTVASGNLAWLIELLGDAGFYRVEHTMNGPDFAALRWSDLHSWLVCTRQEVEPRFLRDLIYLSGEVAAQIKASSEIGAQAPFDPARD